MEVLQAGIGPPGQEGWLRLNLEMVLCCVGGKPTGKSLVNYLNPKQGAEGGCEVKR
jgi:hypothetical protein